MSKLPAPLSLSEGIEILVELGVPEDIFHLPATLLEEESGQVHALGSYCLTNAPFDKTYREVERSLSEIADKDACDCYYFEDKLSGWGLGNELLQLLTLLQRPLEEGPVAYFDLYATIQDTLDEIDLAPYEGQVSAACLAQAHMLLCRLRDYHGVLLSWLRSPMGHQAYRDLLEEDDLGAPVTLGLHSYSFNHCSSLEAAFVLSYGSEVPKEGTQLVVAPERLVQFFLDRTHFLSLESFCPETVTLQEGDTPEIIEAALALWNPHDEGALRELEAAFQAGRDLLR